MDELDIDLSKKSKIIKIRSEKKKLDRFEVSDFSKKSWISRIFVPGFQHFEPKTVPCCQNCQNREKVFLIMLSQFLCFEHNFWYTLS